MKPHEETWRAGGGPLETTCAVYDEASDEMVADLRLHRTVDVESARARLIAAAPEMARALIGLLERPDGCPMCDEGVLRNGSAGHWPECPYPTARAVLAKAGVL